MPARYAPLPNPTDRDADREMDAAFGDESDDEGDESQPLNPAPTSPPAHIARTPTNVPGTYDFENVDYDYPPPGSPPGPSARALPNEHGNSNGLIPTFTVDTARGPRPGWFNRTAAAILPSHYVQRLGLGSSRSNQVIGNNNDGVFSNVSAKPSAPVRIQDGDSTYLVPEETRAEPPPSYASAQADAVPQYWETTVHAPFAPGIAGEVIIDSLPSGSLFSFLWNMLVSISFQLVGFLLTYLLHTTHAARLGSRAGLGVTLIQYGFALRSKGEGEEGTSSSWSGWGSSRQTFPTAAEASAYYNVTAEPLPPSLSQEQTNAIIADATSEWLSFFLMTIGWFILLTSVLGFWRVKRWERGVLQAQRENPGAAPPQASSGPFFGQFAPFERSFGLRGMNRTDLFRQGFGLNWRRDDPEHVDVDVEAGETDFMIPADADPERARQLQEAIQNERRLHAELRAAGLL